MIERLKNYLEDELKEVKKSKQVDELKEELLGNLVDKYEEYQQLGYSEDQAFVESIKSIGDLKELLAHYQIVYEPKVTVKTKDVNAILSNHKSDEQFVYDKTMGKINTLNYIAIGIALLSFILFYSITWITYRESIGFMVQMILLIISGFLYLFASNATNNLLGDMDSIFNNKIVALRLLSIMKNRVGIATAFLINSILLTIPYLILDAPIFVNSIINFRYYLSHVWLYLLVGLLLSFVLVFYVINSIYTSKMKLYDSTLKTNLQIHTDYFINKVNWVRLIRENGILIFLLIISLALTKNTFLYIIPIYFVLMAIWDLFMIIKYKTLIYFRLGKILFGVAAFVNLNSLVFEGLYVKLMVGIMGCIGLLSFIYYGYLIYKKQAYSRPISNGILYFISVLVIFSLIYSNEGYVYETFDLSTFKLSIICFIIFLCIYQSTRLLVKKITTK